MSNLLNAEKLLQSLNLDLGEDDYEEPLNILIESVNNEANLNYFGKLAFEYQIKKHLKIRSQIFQKSRSLPNANISTPVFVIGLPRSGTTFLFNLLSLDSEHRSPLFWEMMNPLPLCKPGSFAESMRVMRSRTILFSKNRFISKLDDLHEITARSPEECLLIKVFALRSVLYFYMANTPTFLSYLEQSDRTVSYLWHRRFLKVLQTVYKPKRWLLKDPSHLGNLDEILSIYPDARFIQIHRDPAETIPSICSLTSQVRRGFTDSVNLHELGKRTLEFWENSKKRNEKQMKNLKDDQYIDVYYEDLIKNPLLVIQEIYTKFNFSLEKENKELMKSYIEKSVITRKEKHIYTLEEYGLNKKEVHNRLQ